MPVRIRLQRRGRKKKAFFYIVAADSRAPRDGKFIEKLGVYNPLTQPATIELNRDSALNWLQNGAQPSNTAKRILSYKGVLYKKHLLRGVKLGIFDEKVAEEKFEQWLKDHEEGISKSQTQQKENKLKEQEEAIAEAKKIREEKEAKAKAEKEAAEAEAKKKEEEAAAEKETRETELAEKNEETSEKDQETASEETTAKEDATTAEAKEGADKKESANEEDTKE